MKKESVLDSRCRDGELNGVAAGKGHAVASGGYKDPGQHTLIETLNSSKTAFATTAHPAAESQLYGVTQLKGTDWWTVGSEQVLSPPGSYTVYKSRTFVLSRKGNTPWVRIPSPNVDTVSWDGIAFSDNVLLAVSASSASNVWAVGAAGDRQTIGSTDYSCLAMRWDGSIWSVVACDQVGPGSSLTGVATLSVADAWAVGWYYTVTGAAPLIQHWNGKAWTAVPIPGLPGKVNQLNAVAALDSKNIWAVGTHADSPASMRPLILRRDGTSWKRETTVPGVWGHLQGVSAFAADDAWAVGWYKKKDSPGKPRPLLLHWDGIRWKQVHAEELPSSAALRGVAHVSSTEAWAVGTQSSQVNPYGVLTLAMRWNGVQWKLVSCV